jgi:hypothetical protein
MTKPLRGWLDTSHLAAPPRDRDRDNPEDGESTSEYEQDDTTMAAKGQNAQDNT